MTEEKPKKCMFVTPETYMQILAVRERMRAKAGTDEISLEDTLTALLSLWHFRERMTDNAGFKIVSRAKDGQKNEKKIDD